MTLVLLVMTIGTTEALENKHTIMTNGEKRAIWGNIVEDYKEGQMTLIQLNMTSWQANKDQLMRLEGDILATQEVRLSKGARKSAMLFAGHKGYTGFFGKG